MAIFSPVSAHWLADQDGWPQIVDKPVSELLNISLTEISTVIKGVRQTLSPDAILAQTNITGAVTDIDEDPDSPDANWMAGSGAIVLQVSFPSPTANLVTSIPQEFRVRVRPGT